MKSESDDLSNSFQLGRRVEQITMIADMEGMGPHFLWRPGLDYTKAVSCPSLFWLISVGRIC